MEAATGVSGGPVDPGDCLCQLGPTTAEFRQSADLSGHVGGGGRHHSREPPDQRDLCHALTVARDRLQSAGEVH